MKPSIVAREFSHVEIQIIVSQLCSGPVRLVAFNYLYGGLSTTTVKVKVVFHDREREMVLKIFYPNPASVETFQNAMDICAFLADRGVPVAGPAAGRVVEMVTLPCGLRVPCFLITLIPNAVAGDVAVEQMGVSRTLVLDGMGRILGQIHSAEATSANLVSYTKGGAVELARHIANEFMDEIASRGNQEFNELYRSEQQLLTEPELFPIGLIHGDPFMDNFLLDKESLEVVGVVDFEDACVGPLIFDLGSAIAGSCFIAELDGTYRLDFAAVHELLAGYMQMRKLTPIEQSSIMKWARIALLCNCTFRFLMYFGKSENSDAYRDLFDKIVYLRNNVAQIEEKMNSVLSEIVQQ